MFCLDSADLPHTSPSAPFVTWMSAHLLPIIKISVPLIQTRAVWTHRGEALSPHAVPTVQHTGGSIMQQSCRPFKFSFLINTVIQSTRKSPGMLRLRSTLNNVDVIWRSGREETRGSLIKRYANSLLSVVSQKGEANNISIRKTSSSDASWLILSLLQILSFQPFSSLRTRPALTWPAFIP